MLRYIGHLTWASCAAVEDVQCIPKSVYVATANHPFNSDPRLQKPNFVHTI